MVAFHLPPNSSGVLNVDLSTLSAATDVAYGFGIPLESIADLNFQSSQDAGLPERVLLYNAALHFRYRVPVRSVIILLRPTADHIGITGRHFYAVPGQNGKLQFEYEVIRLWELSVQQMLLAGPGVLPLAMLCQLPEGVPVEEALAGVVREIDRRVREEASFSEASALMMAT